MLLILMILLQPLLVGRRVLGADQGMRRTAPFGLPIQITLVSADLLFEMIATLLPGAKPVHRLVRIFEEPLQFGALPHLQVRAAARR